ncbi:hypothetical protein JCM5296_005571 [Sporobolomyces johnsonii]
MLSPRTAPLPPSPAPKTRLRSQTMTSPAPPASRSPTFIRTYQQPVGTGSQRRREGQSGGHPRSRSQGDVALGSSGSGIGKGKRRAVFCDVVVDELELDEAGECIYPSVAGGFVNSLGTPVHLPEAGPSQPPPLRPMTPGKPPKVDLDKVRQNLHELWVTEQSYLRKVKSLLQDYAVPLRSFSKKRETAIIPQFEANHLFINIEQLVPIAEAFEHDLRRVVEQLQRDKTRLPSGFGEVILSHVERMEPFKKWLANVGASEAIRRELDQRNGSFREFVERTQVHSRESAQTTGGFKEFLAEPFQRVSRYRLMIDPIIHHLPQDDENVEPLQIAAGILTEICSMRIDNETRRAAIFWSLRETIDGFPDAMMAYDRQFIDCIDVEEVIEVAEARPTALRCTLFLFNDILLIAKRPASDKSGKVHAGLDDVDRLIGLFQTSHLSSAQANRLGSPKKLKPRVLGFRGLVDLSTVVAVDLGPSEFGLVFDQPPMDQSERWCGRPARKFIVANTYAPDVKRAEKEVWLNKMAETVLHGKLRMGARAAMRSKRIWADGGSTDSMEVYWSVWDRRTWEGLRGAQKGKLVLQLDEDGEAAALGSGGDGRPLVFARAIFLEQDRCRFEVWSADSGTNTAETISVDRVAPAVAEVGMSYGLYSFPTVQPLTLTTSRTRPRSGLLSAALDVFGGGSSLKRGHSLTSKTSSGTTTTAETPNLGASMSPRPTTPLSPFGSLSFRASAHPPQRRPVEKKSAPDLYGRASSRMSAMFDSPMQDDGGLSENDADLAELRPRGTLDRGSRRSRRSLSLPPPPHARFDSPTPSPNRTPRSITPFEDDGDLSIEPDTTMDASFDASAFEPSCLAPAWPMPQEFEAPTTSPIAYRPPSSQTRRRMIGPRDMRPPPSAGEPAAASPLHLPFAMQHSPSPQRRAQTSTSTATYQSSPSHSETDGVRENTPPSSSSVVSKRPRPPVEASPRPTPAKKVASLADAGSAPRAPSSLGQPQSTSSRVPSGSLAQRRIPSGAHIKIRSRRVTSAASTIRGPPTPPKKEEVADVFSSPAEQPAKRGELDVDMGEPDDISPFRQLRTHIDELRLKLAREVANKENERIVSPTSISRSPHTRNVFAKSMIGDPSSPSSNHTFSSLSEARPKPHNIDLQVLSRWVRTLDDLVGACEAALPAAPSPAEPTGDGPSAIEFEMLEQERDLIAADLEAIKDEVLSLVDEGIALKKALEAAQTENGKLRQAYGDIVQEADVLLAEFNVALETVTASAQAEPDATGEYVELTNDLQRAVSQRFQAERDLREYKRAMQVELDEKAEWGRLLREHGLLP